MRIGKSETNKSKGSRAASLFKAVAPPVALAMLVAACGSASSSSSSSNSNTSTSKALSPYVLHAMVSATGSAASVGAAEEAALKGAQDYVNSTGGIDGHPLQIAIQDNQSNPVTAVSLASNLIASKVPIIMAGTIGSTIAGVDKLATSTGPVIWNLSPVNEGAPHSYVFADSASLPQLILASMEFAREQGWTRIAALTTSDTSGVTGWNSLQSALQQPTLSGIKVVAHETFDPADISVATELAVIKASHPQAVFEWSTGTPTTVFYQDYAQAGMTDIPVITGYGNAEPTILEKFANQLPTNLYFANERFELGYSALTGSAATITKAFYDEMKSHNTSAGADASLAWDPVMIVVAALRHLGVNATATQIRDYIETIQGFQGAAGVYNFSPTNHRGYSQDSVLMTQWIKQTNSLKAFKLNYPPALLQ